MQKKKLALIAVIFLLVILPIIYLMMVIYPSPQLPDYYQNAAPPTVASDGTARFGNNWLRQNHSGNWESYIEGDAFERGLAIGQLHRHLIQEQEDVFVAEIKKTLPNSILRSLLQLGIGWFNRNLDKSIPEEYLQEIYGVSQAFSDDYAYIGPKFNRILNYHAAHDIGHMVQNMNLVACTAIAQWDFSGGNSQMIVGRNFDFYFGDDFAKNKIVLFVHPEKGYDFVSVTWGGFSGVVSAMNEKGLTVTLNSLPSTLPTQSNTPVSLIAREIAQYATTIDEALAIVQRHKVFVSESFTIASVLDRKAAVIEKTPDTTAIFYPEGNRLVVSNHFQSEALKNSELNQSHLKESESLPRFLRMNELADADTAISVVHTLRYLREQNGPGDQPLGMGNPMAINQLLAHHGVIFDPVNLIAYVSAAPFQINTFNAYSLRDMASYPSVDLAAGPAIDSLRLEADDFFGSDDFERFLEYKKLKVEIKHEAPSLASAEETFTQLISLNPDYYEPYHLAGDYFWAKEKEDLAKLYYLQALERPIPYANLRREMEEKLSKLK